MGHIDPSRENWEAFKALPRDTPIHMLNLIKFRERAEYPAGHPNHGQDLSGREAYAIYKAGLAPIVTASGARPSTRLISRTPSSRSTRQTW